MYKEALRPVRTDWIKDAAWAAVLGHAAAVVLLGICAALIWRNLIPEELMAECTIGAVLIGGIAAGLCMASREGKGAVNGLSGGLAFLVLLSAIGMYREQLTFFDLDYIRCGICSLTGGTFGGIISTGKKNKKGRLRNGKYTRSNHR